MNSNANKHNVNKTTPIHFALTPSEKEELKKLSEMRGVSMSEVCRIALAFYAGYQHAKGRI